MNKLFLFMSHYSEQCKKILSLTENLKNDINIICVDNPGIRNTILKDKKYMIRNVPTILLNQEGTYKKYEGEHATNLLTDIYNNKMLEIKKQTEQQQNHEQQLQIIQKQKDMIANYENKQTQLQQQLNQLQQQPQQPQSNIQQQPQSQQPQGRTSIMDLDDEDDEQENQVVNNQTIGKTDISMVLNDNEGMDNEGKGNQKRNSREQKLTQTVEDMMKEREQFK